MKLLRYLAFGLGGVVAVVTALVLVVYLLVDTDRLQSELVQLVQVKKQRALRFDGDFELHFLPSLGVRISRAGLSEHKSEKPFVTVEEARVSLQWLPLLQREIVVDQVDMQGVMVRLMRRADGSLNVDDLLRPEKESHTVRFDLARARVRDLSIQVEDQQAGRRLQLEEGRLLASRLASEAQGHLELEGRLGMDHPEARGELTLDADYSMNLPEKRFDLDKLNLRLNGQLAGVEGLEMALTASQFRSDLMRGSAELEKLEFSAQGKQGDERGHLRINLPRVVSQKDGARLDALSATFQLTGKHRSLRAAATYEGLDADAKSVRASKSNLDVEGRVGETVLKLAVASPFSGRVGEQLLEFSPLQGQAELTHPRLAKPPLVFPLKGKARLDLAKAGGSMDLQTRLEADALRLKAALQLARNPIDIRVDLEADRLDLRPHFVAAPAKGAREAPLDLASFQLPEGVAFAGGVRIGHFWWGETEASGVRAELKARDGRLELGPVAAAVFGGNLSGSMSLDLAAGRMAMRPGFTQVALKPLLHQVLGWEAVSGKGDLALELEGAGDNWPSMLESLAGSGRLTVREGVVRGIDLQQALQRFRPRVVDRKNVAEDVSATAETELRGVQTSFRLANGVVASKDWVLTTPAFRVAGAGELDLRNARVELDGKATTQATTGDLAIYKGLELPLHLAGPLRGPRLEFRYADLKLQPAAGGPASSAQPSSPQGKAGAGKPAHKR